MRRHLAGLMMALAVAGAAGCDDERAAALTAPPVPHDGSAAFLTVSDPAAPVGTTVTVTAVVREAQAGHTVGAFTATLRYDAAALAFVREHELGAGMRALNPMSGEIRAAGASPDGFARGELFAVTFRVLRAGALETLDLGVSELSSVGFDDQTTSLRVHRSVFPAPRR